MILGTTMGVQKRLGSFFAYLTYKTIYPLNAKISHNCGWEGVDICTNHEPSSLSSNSPEVWTDRREQPRERDPPDELWQQWPKEVG